MVADAADRRGGGAGNLVGPSGLDAVDHDSVAVRNEVDLHPLANLEIRQYVLVGGAQLHPIRKLDQVERSVDEADPGHLDPAIATAGPIGHRVAHGPDESQ